MSFIISEFLCTFAEKKKSYRQVIQRIQAKTKITEVLLHICLWHHQK